MRGTLCDWNRKNLGIIVLVSARPLGEIKTVLSIIKHDVKYLSYWLEVNFHCTYEKMRKNGKIQSNLPHKL